MPGWELPPIPFQRKRQSEAKAGLFSFNFGSNKKKRAAPIIPQKTPSEEPVVVGKKNEKKGKKVRKTTLKKNEDANKLEPEAGTSSMNGASGVVLEEMKNLTTADEASHGNSIGDCGEDVENNGSQLKGDAENNGNQLKEDAENNGSQLKEDAENNGSQLEEGSEEEEMTVIIDERRDEYKTLQNANQTNNVLMLSKVHSDNVAGFMEPEFELSNADEVQPGVQASNFLPLNNSTGIGYIQIKARTVKPPEVFDDAKLVFWILDGRITVKSGGGHYQHCNGGGIRYLFGKEMTKGASVIIPKNTVYTFENWTEKDALMAYCVIGD